MASVLTTRPWPIHLKRIDNNCVVYTVTTSPFWVAFTWHRRKIYIYCIEEAWEHVCMHALAQGKHNLWANCLMSWIPDLEPRTFSGVTGLHWVKSRINIRKLYEGIIKSYPYQNSNNSVNTSKYFGTLFTPLSEHKWANKCIYNTFLATLLNKYRIKVCSGVLKWDTKSDAWC